jgi:hypothetical protein
LFQSLQELIAGYPVTEALRSALLDHLHERLAETLPGDASGVVLRATRALTLTSAEELAGGALVDALKHANEELLKALDAAGGPPPEEMAAAYAQFIEEWCGKEHVDAHLVRHELTILPLSNVNQKKSSGDRNCIWWAAYKRSSNVKAKMAR